MGHLLDYHSPAPPKPQEGARADIAALVMFLISGGLITLLACGGGSGFGGLCAIRPFSAIGTTLGVVGVRERRWRGFSVAVLTLNALALVLSVWALMRGLSWLSDSQ